MQIHYIVVADYANVTKEEKVNIMGVFDRIHTAGFPCKHPLLFLVFRMIPDFGERGIRKMKVRLVSEKDNSELFQLEGPIDISQFIVPGANAIIDLRDLVFPHEGRYHFMIMIDDERAAETHIDLVKLPTR